jgi:hypothetical protein
MMPKAGGNMQADYIKLSSRSVEASGRHVTAAIWSFLALRVLAWSGWLILSLAAGGSAWGFAAWAFRLPPL